MSRKKEPPPQFIAVTADEYELTLGAFDTVKEMCEWSGHKKFAIYQSMENGRVLRKGPAKGCKGMQSAALGKWPVHHRRIAPKAPPP